MKTDCSSLKKASVYPCEFGGLEWISNNRSNEFFFRKKLQSTDNQRSWTLFEEHMKENCVHW